MKFSVSQPAAPDPFDRAALAARRARVQPEALFLHRVALDEVQDRLSMVKRRFTAPAIVTPFMEIWQEAFRDAELVMDDEVLPLVPGAHDLVIHAMTLHWANDPVGQLIQCRRALRPDGLMLAVALGGQSLHQLRSALGQAEAEVTGGLSPRVSPMAELRDMGSLLQRAGFALPVADNVELTAEYNDLRHLMRDLREMGETNVMAGRQRHPTRRAIFDRAEAHYREHFETQAGRLPVTFDLICLTGWAPDDSQPKPLRPGSASARLADALDTEETRLPD